MPDVLAVKEKVVMGVKFPFPIAYCNVAPGGPVVEIRYDNSSEERFRV